MTLLVWNIDIVVCSGVVWEFQNQELVDHWLYRDNYDTTDDT